MIKRAYLILLMFIIFPVLAFAQGQESVSITTYYPAPYGEYITLRLNPNHNPPTCDGSGSLTGALHYDDGTTVLTGGLAKGLYYCSNGSWQPIGAGGGSYWTLNGTNLYTNDSSGGSRWNVGIGTTTPNAALQVIGGISRNLTFLYGNPDAIATHVNLGGGEKTWTGQPKKEYYSITGTYGLDMAYCTVSGGWSNRATNNFSTVAGGKGNTASGEYATISGALSNTASGKYSTKSAGYSDKVTGYAATASGGCSYDYLATGAYATVSGGQTNYATADYSTVAGGFTNAASGQYSFAAGNRAKATHSGSFVFADETSTAYNSNADNSFNVRASNGVYLNGGSSFGCDIAEFMDVLKSDAVKEAELVSLKDNNRLTKTSQPYDEDLIGVVSSKKTFTLHLASTKSAFPDTQRLPIALVGRSFVKVSLEGGVINVGDPITSSSTPGIGMKATKPGKIIGYAMQKEDFKHKHTKEILVFVNAGYYVTEEVFDRLERLKALKKELKTIKQQLSKLNK